METRSVRNTLAFCAQALAGLAIAAPANAQFFTDVTAEALGCTQGVDCPGWSLSPLLKCSQPGLCVTAAGNNFCIQPSIMLGGGAVGDFDNDGDQDLFVLSGGAAPDRLFINNGAGIFTDMADAWGVDEFHIGGGAAVGDFDDDGWLDIYASSYGPATAPEVGGRHLLYRNTGLGFFEEVALVAGLADSSPTCTDAFGTAFGDMDLDGDLDVAIAGWMDGAAGTRVFENNGDGTFTDVTAFVPTLGDFDGDPLVKGFAPRFADMNGDRYPELLITADFGDGVPVPSRYLVNNGDGTFTDMTDLPGSGLGLDQNGMGQTVADFDKDGDFDWYVTNIYHEELVPGFLTPRTGNKLYMNNGDDTFTEIAELAGVDDGGWGWATEAIDIDHDTDEDIVETNGFPGVNGIFIGERSYLFLNDGTGLNFMDPNTEDAVPDSGLTHTDQGRGLLNFDMDNDGDQDVVIFTYEGEIKVFRNNTVTDGQTPTEAGWLRVLVDTSRDPGVIAPNGYGSLVRLDVAGASQMRLIEGGSNYLAQSELSAHFGVGSATVIDTLTVEFANGLSAERDNVSPNQTITIEFCRGDWTGDGVFNILDFVGYQAAFQSGHPDADIDDNGIHNVFDFTAWQGLYVSCQN